MKLAAQPDLKSRRKMLEQVFIDLDKASAPEWAKGCDRCKFGVIGADYSSSPMPLYQAQPLLAEAGLIRFCDCEAGQAARRNAIGVWREVKDDPHTGFMRVQLEAWVTDEFRPTVNGEKVQP